MNCLRFIYLYLIIYLNLCGVDGKKIFNFPVTTDNNDFVNNK